MLLNVKLCMPRMYMTAMVRRLRWYYDDGQVVKSILMCNVV